VQKFEANVHEGLLDTIICCLPDFVPKIFFNVLSVSAKALQTTEEPRLDYFALVGAKRKKKHTNFLARLDDRVHGTR
jgi:hypothetical protein